MARLNDILGKEHISSKRRVEPVFNHSTRGDELHLNDGLRRGAWRNREGHSEDSVDYKQSSHNLLGTNYDNKIDDNSILRTVLGLNGFRRWRAKSNFDTAYKARGDWQTHPESVAALAHYIELASDKELASLETELFNQRHAENPNVYFAAGKIKRRQNKLEEAIALYDKAIDLDHSFLPALTEIADTHLMKARIFSADGNLRNGTDEQGNIKYTEILRGVHAYELALNELAASGVEEFTRDIALRLLPLYGDLEELERRGAQYTSHLWYHTDSNLVAPAGPVGNAALAGLEEEAQEEENIQPYQTQLIKNAFGVVYSPAAVNNIPNREQDVEFNTLLGVFNHIREGVRQGASTKHTINTYIDLIAAIGDKAEESMEYAVMTANSLFNISEIYAKQEDQLNALVYAIKADHAFPGKYEKITNEKNRLLKELAS